MSENNKDEIIEELLSSLEGAANMMRGMLFDPSIHSEAKNALSNKTKEIDSLTEKYNT